MITLLKDLDINLINSLCNDHYKRKIKASFYAYGTKFEFCKFFLVSFEEKSGIISLFNSSMVISFQDEFNFCDELISEIADFIHLYSPFSIESSVDFITKMSLKLGEKYNSNERTEFSFSYEKNNEINMEIDEIPKLDDVFNILKKSFEAFETLDAYELWLTDTSHKIRHGISQVFLAQKRTTATLQYIIDDVALIGHVATLPEFRGQFLARKMLFLLGEKLHSKGIEVRLFARKHRVSYYKEIGFLPINVDIVLERKE